jgi:ectoine hydroxylase-related dioxygenase (phytanoyl-CoA dioxygenase family)
MMPWHQDLTICVQERVEVAGFGPWSVKDGILHVQPPVEILEQMITVRVHLDGANESNGALKVIPGSHMNGKLSPEQIASFRAQKPEVLCTGHSGDLLLMRPLLLHSSSRNTTDQHRRVLHMEYAGCQLPDGLQWQQC